jgi:hypothetical protein
MYFCLVVRGGGRRYLLVVLVGDGDALEGGFQIGNLHDAKMRRQLTNEDVEKVRDSYGKLLKVVDVLRLTR